MFCEQYLQAIQVQKNQIPGEKWFLIHIVENIHQSGKALRPLTGDVNNADFY